MFKLSIEKIKKKRWHTLLISLTHKTLDICHIYNLFSFFIFCLYWYLFNKHFVMTFADIDCTQLINMKQTDKHCIFSEWAMFILGAILLCISVNGLCSYFVPFCCVFSEWAMFIVGAILLCISVNGLCSYLVPFCWVFQ